MTATKRMRDYQRRSTKERGYSGEHPRERRQWEPVVDAGMAWCRAVVCLMPSRWIQPGSKWHLGHTADRTSWTGPEHQRCNTSDGARRGNRRRGQRRAVAKATTSARWQPSASPLRTSRQW